MLPPLRLFIEARNKANDLGLSDNQGAIHSIERILDILALKVCFPHLNHTKDVKRDARVEHSRLAHEALGRGEQVHVEHVYPRRAFALEIIRRIKIGHSDKTIIDFIKKKYRLVLLTKDERAALDKKNRTRHEPQRLRGIALHEVGSD